MRNLIFFILIAASLISAGCISENQSSLSAVSTVSSPTIITPSIPNAIVSTPIPQKDPIIGTWDNYSKISGTGTIYDGRGVHNIITFSEDGTYLYTSNTTDREIKNSGGWAAQGNNVYYIYMTDVQPTNRQTFVYYPVENVLNNEGGDAYPGVIFQSYSRYYGGVSASVSPTSELLNMQKHGNPYEVGSNTAREQLACMQGDDSYTFDQCLKIAGGDINSPYIGSTHGVTGWCYWHYDSRCPS